MTVREWFRLQRAELWNRDIGLAADIDKIAAAITIGQPPDHWVRIGSLRWIESVETYLERERVFTLVKRDMDEAMRRLAAGRYLVD